jgi:hypothetical protein
MKWSQTKISRPETSARWTFFSPTVSADDDMAFLNLLMLRAY